MRHVKGAAEARDDRAQGEDEEFVVGGRVPAEQNPGLAVPDGALDESEFGGGEPAAQEVNAQEQHPRGDEEPPLRGGAPNVEAHDSVEVGEPVVSPHHQVVPEEHQRGAVGERLGEDGKIHPFDSGAEREETKEQGHQAREGNDHESGEPGGIKRAPEPGQEGVSQEHHEIREAGGVLAGLGVGAQGAGEQHEVHAKHVASEAEEEGLAQGEQAGVTPEQVDAEGEHGVAEVFAPEVDGEVADDARRVEQRHHDQHQNRQKGHDGGFDLCQCAVHERGGTGSGWNP